MSEPDTESLLRLIQWIVRRLPLPVFDLGQIRTIHFQIPSQVQLRDQRFSFCPRFAIAVKTCL